MNMTEKVRNKEKGDDFWKPEEGECIGGLILDIRSISSKFGSGQRKVIELKREEDGKVVLVPCHSVIEREMDKQQAEVGDMIGIKYLGKTKGANSEYHDCVVEVEKMNLGSSLSKEGNGLEQAEKRENLVF